MFTGIVQSVVKVRSLQNHRLDIGVPAGFAEIRTGESIAINGCCLTVVEFVESLSFDLSDETIGRTNLGRLVPGDEVNIERALRPIDRIGGHFVQGHVDSTAEVLKIDRESSQSTIHFAVAAEFDKFLIDKGSISLDGISLTVVSPHDGRFACAIVPHTWKNTNLKSRKPGDRLNVEFDLIAKHLEKLARVYPM